jgi:aerobactin synthase
MINNQYWKTANIQLICKAISELHYEEILPITKKENHFLLIIDDKTKYQFKARKSAFNHLIIDVQSLTKNNSQNSIYAAQFFHEIETFTKMGEITLAHFIQELNNTLFSEMVILENKAKMIKSLDQKAIDKISSGHPKILLNKGRIGFNFEDLKKYSPEQSDGIQLFWIAIKKQSLYSILTTDSINELYHHLTTTEINHWSSKVNTSEYLFIPTHPWQWDNFLRIQFQHAIFKQEILPLGLASRIYHPEISIRTLKDKNNDLKTELKLSLNILNTSAYRGIPSQSIQAGPLISQKLEILINNDPILRKSNISILTEKVAFAFQHSDFEKIGNAPYRFHESLGFILRSTVESKINSEETALLSGSLFVQFNDGQSVAGYLIKKSKIKAQQWISLYTENVLIPLYHLQLKYGIGLVAHGQNIIIKLKNNIPSGVIIKDFQGDLRISQESVLKNQEGFNQLKVLPKEHLIHDLITGHFLTTLRFISPLLESENVIKEEIFYQTIGMIIAKYLKQNYPEIHFEHPLSLLRSKFEKIILNKVRFQMGYQDTVERLLPSLGSEIENPLHKGLMK